MAAVRAAPSVDTIRAAQAVELDVMVAWNMGREAARGLRRTRRRAETVFAATVESAVADAHGVSKEIYDAIIAAAGQLTREAITNARRAYAAGMERMRGAAGAPAAIEAAYGAFETVARMAQTTEDLVRRQPFDIEGLIAAMHATDAAVAAAKRAVELAQGAA
jgi:hypothetical protein